MKNFFRMNGSNLGISSFFTFIAICLLISILTQPANGEEFEKTISLLKQYNNQINKAATLYNLGPYRKDETERVPHRNPVANEYGYVAKDFFNSAYLRETFPE